MEKSTNAFKLRISIELGVLGVVLSLSSAGCFQKVNTSLATLGIEENPDAKMDHSSFTTCLGCHETARPKGVISGIRNSTIQFDHTVTGQQDCNKCHVAGVNWEYNHSPAPETCNTCHELSRPVGSIMANPTPVTYAPYTTINPSSEPIPAITYNHTQAGNQECKNCHTIGGNWKFTHSPLPTSCNGCHEAQRPNWSILCATQTNSALSNYQPIPQSPHFNAYDCFYCHKTPTEAQPLFRWTHKTASGTSSISTPGSPFKDLGGGCGACHTPHSPVRSAPMMCWQL